MVGRERRGGPVNGVSGTPVRFAHRKTECGELCVPSELHLVEECPHARSDIPYSETERYRPQEDVNGFRSNYARNVHHEGFSLGSCWVATL
jgi:hypothetical protein